MAAWPSGKAGACKAFIPSSNLGAAFYEFQGVFCMGKIFGICDLPVSTIHSALNPVVMKRPKQVVTNLQNNNADTFVVKEKIEKSNFFVKMRNGIGRLMPHFSKTKKSGN